MGEAGTPGMTRRHHARASSRARRVGAEPADARGARMAISAYKDLLDLQRQIEM
jgi:hypothetical protein